MVCFGDSVKFNAGNGSRCFRWRISFNEFPSNSSVLVRQLEQSVLSGFSSLPFQSTNCSNSEWRHVVLDVAVINQRANQSNCAILENQYVFIKPGKVKSLTSDQTFSIGTGKTALETALVDIVRVSCVGDDLRDRKNVVDGGYHTRVPSLLEHSQHTRLSTIFTHSKEYVLDL